MQSSFHVNHKLLPRQQQQLLQVRNFGKMLLDNVWSNMFVYRWLFIFKGDRKKRSPSDEQAPPTPPNNGLSGMPANLKAQYEFLALYMGLNEKVRLSIGHQFADFIKECTFLGSDCLNIRYFLSDILQTSYMIFQAILKTCPVQLTELVIPSIPTSLVRLRLYCDLHCPVLILVSQSLWILIRFSICKIASPRMPEQGKDVSHFVECWFPQF